jgi:TetR/AcrR family transcriptional regulator, regulator of mycofactocin system
MAEHGLRTASTAGTTGAAGSSGSRVGRRRLTSRGELEHVAFDLFGRHGFDRTTVDDIAAAAGISRRTFFRYFPSKNDVVWGDFDGMLDRMRERLAACPPGRPLMDEVREALLDFNRVPAGELPWHRRRMALILRTPALQAHSTLRYADWRAVLAGFVGERLRQPADALAPQAIAHATLGVAVAAYEHWLRDQGADLLTLLDAAMRELAASFGHL